MGEAEARAMAEAIVEAVTKALGTKLAHYMKPTQESALQAAYEIIRKDV